MSTEDVSGTGRSPSPWGERPRFALDADVTVYWPDVRPCWEQDDENAPASPSP